MTATASNVVLGDGDLTDNIGTAAGGTLGFLTVTGAADIGARRIETVGAQLYDGAVTMTEDFPDSPSNPPLLLSEASTIEFTSTVDGPGDFRVQARDGITFNDDIGAATPVAEFSAQVIDTAGLIRFAKTAATEQIVMATDDLLLNQLGRASVAPENRATMFRSEVGDLRLESANGDIEMGVRERLTVPGTLTLRALNGTARIADLSGVGFGNSAVVGWGVDVIADQVAFLLRETSDVVLPAGSTDPTAQDFGIDIIGNRVRIISNAGDPILISPTGGSSGVVTIGTQHGQTAEFFTNERVTNFDVANGLDIRGGANKTDLTLLTAADFEEGGMPGRLDGIPLGATPPPPPQVQPPPVQEPPEPPEIGPEKVKKDEVISWLQCAELEAGEEVPEECEGLAAEDMENEEEFESASALGALELYRSLMRSAETTQAMSTVFRGAIDGYRAQAGPGEFAGADFRDFVDSSDDYESATDYLDQFSFLFEQLSEMNMTPTDFALLREELLMEVVDELDLGDLTTPEEFGNAIDGQGLGGEF